jgi:hypothetical protein
MSNTVPTPHNLGNQNKASAEIIAEEDAKIFGAKIPEELQKRVEAAAKVMCLSVESMWKCLDVIGIENNQDGLILLDADTTTESDAKTFFCDPSEPIASDCPVKIARFKAGWAVLKGKIKTEIKEGNGVAAIVESLKSVDQLPDEKLLEKYAQQGQDCSDTIMNRLKSICHNRPFVIFDGEQIDLPETLKLLRIARRQDTPSTWLVERVDNSAEYGPNSSPTMKKVMVRPAAVGEFPNAWLEDCPIHGDTILIDGYCEKCQNSWKGVIMEDRIMVRIASEVGAIDRSYVAIKNWIELIFASYSPQKPGYLKSWKDSLAPSTFLRYNELKEENKLPVLRRKMSKGQSCPFGHKTY